MFKIKSPHIQYNGKNYGLMFFDGLAETDDKKLAERLKALGYLVTNSSGKNLDETAKQEPVAEPVLNDIDGEPVAEPLGNLNDLLEEAEAVAAKPKTDMVKFQALKDKADELGVRYHPNIGYDKLLHKVKRAENE